MDNTKVNLEALENIAGGSGDQSDYSIQPMDAWGTIKAEGVYLRQGPSLCTHEFKKVDLGTRIHIIGDVLKCGNTGTWYQVSVDGATGFLLRSAIAWS